MSKEYELDLEANHLNLLNREKSGRYCAPAVRRVHIPKGKNSTCSIGILTLEDKTMQRAVTMVLKASYEEDFYSFFSGFRPKRLAHGALRDLWEGTVRVGGEWVLEAGKGGKGRPLGLGLQDQGLNH